MHEELVIAGAYSRAGNDDKALDWYKRAADEGQSQGLPSMVLSQEALAHFYSIKTDPDMQTCGKQYEDLRSTLIADGSPEAQTPLVEVDMLHSEDLISHVRKDSAQIGSQQSSVELTQSNDLLWRALSRAKSTDVPNKDKAHLIHRIQSDQQLLSTLVQ